MADLKASFEQGRRRLKNLPEKPDNMTLLKIYALYKQASSGDVDGKRPGFTDMVGRAKWDAWNEAQGQGTRRGDAGVRRPDRVAEVGAAHVASASRCASAAAALLRLARRLLRRRLGVLGQQRVEVLLDLGFDGLG